MATTAKILPRATCIQILNDFIKSAKENEKKFAAVKAMPNQPPVAKWGATLEVLMPLRFEVLKSHGFEDPKIGTQAFTTSLMSHLKEDPSFRTQMPSPFSEVAKTVFGVQSVPAMETETLEKVARELLNVYNSAGLNQAVADLQGSDKPQSEKVVAARVILGEASMTALENLGMGTLENWLSFSVSAPDLLAVCEDLAKQLRGRAEQLIADATK
eukprot:TRINITY_DN75740_c0_g1_i1.p1 TRINITY_DN75740_c0_g1~~TRINITY_DN75740_c0_g1_i1.p1  ORF type:complete len:225 (-),score=16.99 TRINITY_DN75740_c0_g1_i1:73-714(-)